MFFGIMYNLDVHSGANVPNVDSFGFPSPPPLEITPPEEVTIGALS